MAKKRSGGLQISSPGMNEGYPISRVTDGLDTKKIAGRVGFNKQLGRPLNQHTDFKNSKTGECMDAPEWWGEDD